MLAIGHPIVGDEFYAHQEAREFSPRLNLHAAELSFYHPKSEWLKSLFVACEFCPQAEEVIFAHFGPPRKIPDYKTLPKT